MSSPDWSGSEKKRQRYTDGAGEDYFRYRRDPVAKNYRQSPETFSNPHVNKDVKHRTTQEEDFKLRKTSQDSRHRHRHKEVTYRQQHDDSRLMSRYYKDSHHQERSWDHSEERTRSQECSAVVRNNVHDVRLSARIVKTKFCYLLHFICCNETFLYTEQTCGKPRERNGSPSPDHKDHQNRTRIPLTESCGQVGVIHTWSLS